MKQVVVTGSFDQLGLEEVRFLEAAAQLGNLHVLLWSDEVVRRVTGTPAKFPEQERMYVLAAIRYVTDVRLANPVSTEDLSIFNELQPDLLVSDERHYSPMMQAAAAGLGIEYRVLRRRSGLGRVEKSAEAELEVDSGPSAEYRVPAANLRTSARNATEIDPVPLQDAGRTRRKRVIVTGCFDWFHSGHVRFFEEASSLGDLYVVLGHDANIRLLKGEGHPMFPEAERRYMVSAIRYVKQALISSGHGWMDAEPEIARIGPDIYFVNEDGDRPEKRAFCQAHGIEFTVSRRVPRSGLPPRESTQLRGF